MKRAKTQVIDIKLAVDNLAQIADLRSSSALVLLKNGKILTNKNEITSDMTPWMGAEGAEPVLAAIDLTYRSIYQHFTHLCVDEEMDWSDAKSQSGFASMMAAVGESAKKVDAFLEEKIGEPLEQKVEERIDFRNLQNFYIDVFSRKFEQQPVGQKEFQDLETVKRDEEYELFYLRDETGKPYFDKEFLRNIKLGCDFDLNPVSFEEDPILQVRAMVDKDLHASASQILQTCHFLIADFFKCMRNLEGNEFAKALSMAVSALLLSTNSQNLIQNAAPKSALQYFSDFQHFLRTAMHTNEYQRLMAYPSEEKVDQLLLQLCHGLCYSIFYRVGGIKQEAIGLIHRTMRRGEETKQKKGSHLVRGDTIWNQFLVDDEKFRELLAQFPNGPLFKTLDLLRAETDEETAIPFDPICQDNVPSRIYELQIKGKAIDVIRMPSPTCQSHINKAEIVDEWKGFLRARSKKKTHLMFNLQDRTDWKQYARSRAVETLQMNAEFNHELFVITLPKNTDFYHQINEYLKLDLAEDFLNAFFAQLSAAEECGYFFPRAIKQEDLIRFAENALPCIHKLFFKKAKMLSRREREDFIEIFYQFLILKCIELLDPSSVSFTCKDAIDVGAAAAGIFYGFAHLIGSDFTKKEDQDFLRWIFYTPALFIRERAIHAERLFRAISALERIDLSMAENGKAIVKEMGIAAKLTALPPQSK